MTTSVNFDEWAAAPEPSAERLAVLRATLSAPATDFSHDHERLGEGERISARVDTTRVPRDLRTGALVTVRCADCNGMVIAHLTVLSGRPMLWVRQQGGGGFRSLTDGLDHPDAPWLDRDIAHCRARHQYPLSFSVLAQCVVDGRGRRAELVAKHDDTGTVRYH